MLALTALSWLACALPQAESSLPPTPAGWRHERLEFPLAFAPELPFRGVEDLAFAPGMFAPDSDSYFSYALGLRLEGDVRVDEEMLTHFLETYYRGLCRTVAAERKLARDASTIRARVRRVGELFRATVELFDPFVSGAELELALELTSRSTPRTTELLGLASPLAQDEPIWSELRALGKAWRDARAAPVYLNHLYAVVDAETYAALVHSSFLRETFAVSEERTTVRGDLSYSGFYLYGQRTYFEFLPPSAAAGLAEGGTGLAFGVEAEGDLEAFARRLQEREVRTQAAPITRELAGKQVPWFRILGVEMPSTRLNLFAMEYEPRFLASWHAELAPELGGIARAAVLERYAAALELSAHRASALLADVSAVEFALSAAERERLLAVCAAAGCEIEAGSDSWTCLGPQYRLVLRTAPESAGVTGFELALRRPVAHEPMRFGRLELRFRGDTATLALRP